MFRKRSLLCKICFCLMLTVFTVYVMLDTFVIARPMESAAAAAGSKAAARESAGEDGIGTNTARTPDPASEDGDAEASENGEDAEGGKAPAADPAV